MKSDRNVSGVIVKGGRRWSILPRPGFSSAEPAVYFKEESKDTDTIMNEVDYLHQLNADSLAEEKPEIKRQQDAETSQSAGENKNTFNVWSG